MGSGPTKTGREESDRGTRQVRVFEDVGEMISWIIRIEGGTTASLLDPMIRAEITARYLKHEDAIDKIKAAENALKKIENDARDQAKKKPKK